MAKQKRVEWQLKKYLRSIMDIGEEDRHLNLILGKR